MHDADTPEAREPAPALSVLYDGSCPLCRREIGIYRGLRANERVCFTDISGAAPVPPGTTREQLMARFHVRTADGHLLSGAQAFLALWATLPGWRWLARIGRLPGAASIMERAYGGFLQWRPHLQRWALRIEQNRAGHRARARPKPANRESRR